MEFQETSAWDEPDSYLEYPGTYGKEEDAPGMNFDNIEQSVDYPMDLADGNYEPSFGNGDFNDQQFADQNYNGNFDFTQPGNSKLPNLYNIQLPSLPTMIGRNADGSSASLYGQGENTTFGQNQFPSNNDWMAGMNMDPYLANSSLRVTPYTYRPTDMLKKSSSQLSLSSSVTSNQYIHTPAGLMCAFPGCEKVFEKQANLKSHLKSHADERNFVCHDCNATFRRSHDLKRHYRSIHSEVKPYLCSQCRKGFSRQVCLN